MTELQELLAHLATATDEQIGRALEAMKRSAIVAPMDGYLSIVEVRQRYASRRTGRPISRNTVYRKLRQIGVVEPAKRIGGESYFSEIDVVRAFDPGALKTTGQA